MLEGYLKNIVDVDINVVFWVDLFKNHSSKLNYPIVIIRSVKAFIKRKIRNKRTLEFDI